MYEVMVEATFDAAHCLRDYEGPCARIHGHTYRVQVVLRGDVLSNTGMLVDFRDVRSRLHSIVAAFDHQLMNDVPPFDALNPTAENLARYIYDAMKADLKQAVARVTVWETPTACATYLEP
jgi:6-pyruvoyltetrahydropterin/6-carboxytetrahydropterin synthase